MQCFVKFCRIRISNTEYLVGILYFVDLMERALLFQGGVELFVLYQGAYRSRASAAISTRAIAAKVVCVVCLRY